MPVPVLSVRRAGVAAAPGRVELLVLSVIYWLDQVGSHRRLAVLGLGVAVIALRLALLPLIPIPHPWSADEFSYLLGADTFASGRLTNPTPDHWRSFEAIHVIVQPTYASKYPPGQSAFLALGQVAFGNPYWGVVLGMALFCAAVCWMLQAVVSPGWALLGGGVSCIAFGINHYWMESYWGGAVTGFGACLITGSTLRMLTKLRPERYVWPLCAGIPFVFLTRPFEGGVFTATAFLLITAKLWPERRFLNIRRLLVACLITASGMIAFQAYYDWRVTGSPLTLPYSIHERAYSPVPTFWFLPLRTNVPRPSDRVIYSDHWEWEMDGYKEMREKPLWRRMVSAIHREFLVVAVSFGGLIHALWLVPVFWPDRRIRYLVILAVPVLLAGSLVLWTFTHYLAPAIPAVICLMFIVLQKLRLLEMRARARAGTRMTGVALLFLAGFAWGQRPSMPLVGGAYTHREGAPITISPGIVQVAAERDNLIAKLERTGQKHLIIVHYSPEHTMLPDWVHNGANINRQSVIWARDRGAEENRELISSYPDRRVWLLTASGTTYTLRPYGE